MVDTSTCAFSWGLCIKVWESRMHFCIGATSTLALRTLKHNCVSVKSYLNHVCLLDPDVNFSMCKTYIGSTVISGIEMSLSNPIQISHVDIWLPFSCRFRMLKTYLHTITRGLEQNVRFCKCPCHQRSSNCQTCRQCTNVLLERLWCFGVHHPQLKNFNTQELISTCNYLLFQAKRRPI